MTRRDIRAQRKAAHERDYSWLQERDEDFDRDGLVPDDEHTTHDEYADMARQVQQ